MADLSEFTQASPDKTKVGDEFEESGKSSNKINESQTTGIVKQQNDSKISGSSGSKYQYQFKKKKLQKNNRFSKIYKGLDQKFWMGYNQTKPSYWRVNLAQDPISRAIFVREKYAGS